jgi:DNA-binding GntR family transcriptional regulator
MANPRAAINDLAVLMPPPRETLQQRVYGQLRMALMRGEFVPGRSLTIRALAEALRTSSMPVREALRQLVTERALEMLPNRSFGVPRVTRERFEDLLRIRVEVEGYAAAEAASRMGKAEIDRIDEINRTMRAAGEAGDRLRFISGNQEFHFAIYRAAESDTLIPLIETLWLQAGPYMGCLYDTDGLDPVVNLGHHEGVIKALRRRDAEKSRAMLVADITTFAPRILELAMTHYSDESTPRGRDRRSWTKRSPAQQRRASELRQPALDARGRITR